MSGSEDIQSLESQSCKILPVKISERPTGGPGPGGTSWEGWLMQRAETSRAGAGRVVFSWDHSGKKNTVQASLTIHSFKNLFIYL